MRAEPSCRVAFRSTSTTPRNSIPTLENAHYVFGSTSGEGKGKKGTTNESANSVQNFQKNSNSATSHPTDLRLLCAFPNCASHHGREGGGHTRQVQERRHRHRHSWSQSHWPAGGHRGDSHGCAHPRESASLRGAPRRARVQQWERGSVLRAHRRVVQSG